MQHPFSLEAYGDGGASYLLYMLLILTTYVQKSTRKAGK